MIFRSLLLLLPAILLFSSFVQAEDIQTVINELSQHISKEKDPLQKSKLHMYRARHYARQGEWDKGLEDYNLALELNHQGWVHLERSRFLMLAGKYKLAYEDAVAAKNETITLTSEANAIIQQAITKIDAQNVMDNPPTIIMDSRTNPNRMSRFDYMEKLGVFDEKEARLRQARKKSVSRHKQKSTKSSPPVRKSRG